MLKKLEFYIFSTFSGVQLVQAMFTVFLELLWLIQN